MMPRTFVAATAGLCTLLAACAAPAPPATAPQPQTPAPEPAVAAPVRQPPPAPLPARPIEFPPFQETVLPNGLRLIVVEKHDQPVASVSLYVRTGSAADPAAKAGLVGLMSDVLTKGTPRRSARQIASTIEGVGGTLGASASSDYVSVSADVLADDLPLAVDLVSDVALNPAFPREELEIARTRTLSGLQVELSEPGAVAQRRFAREVYGERHPYSLAPLPQTVRAVGRQDLVAFHRRHFRADNAMLVVAGDVSAAQVEALARRHFGAWKGGGVPQPSFVEPPARQASQIYLVHRPGSVQSNLLVGHVATHPDNPDVYALYVLNKIVGGGADSRLFSILREQKGWTYGAYTRLSRPRDVGTFVASAEVRTAVTDSALHEMLAQLRRLRTERVSDAELQAAKSYLTGSFPLRIQTADQIAGQVAQIRLLGLPIEALTSYRDRIDAVTAEEVQRVAQKYIQPDRAAIVVVGDAAQLHDKLAGIAPVSLFTVQGAPMQLSELTVRASGERFDASRLQPASLEYQVLFQGTPVGSSSLTLTREGEGWASVQKLQAGPLNQQTEVRFTSGFSPVSSKLSATQGPVQISAELKYQNGRVTGSSRMPGQMGGDKTIDAPVVEGTIFGGMDPWIIAVADLQPGKTVSVPVFSPQTGTAVNGTFKVVGTEQVTVPAGTFPAFKVETSVGAQSMVLYVRQASPHILLKQEGTMPPISTVLTAIK